MGGVWSALMPERCPLCGEVLPQWGAESLCAECLAAVSPINDPVCGLCGLPLSEASLPPNLICGRCSMEAPHFETARAYGEYNGALAQAIRDFKFRGRRSLAPALGRLMVEADLDRLGDYQADAVAPVPLHPARLRERGFNQAADLARPVARRRGLRLLHEALVRTRPTPEQTGMTFKQRRANVGGAFRPGDGNAVKGKSILLVDDVLTTGATADECSRVLLKAGASKVAVLTLARTP